MNYWHGPIKKSIKSDRGCSANIPIRELTEARANDIADDLIEYMH